MTLLTDILFDKCCVGKEQPLKANINIPKKHRFSFSKVLVLMPYLRQLIFCNKIMCDYGSGVSSNSFSFVSVGCRQWHGNGANPFKL